MKDLTASADATDRQSPAAASATQPATVNRAQPSRSRTARVFYMGAGSMFVGFGVIGMFVPLVPTTIFLILAAACYGRSSPRAYRWLTTNRLFGEYLKNYQEHRGATVRHKIISIASLWIGIGATIVFAPTPWWVNILLLGIAVGVTWHLYAIKTIRQPIKA
jgi:uncharacterized protein